MGVVADAIPRYAEPTGAELEAMFHDQTPGEVLSRCIHRYACGWWNDFDNDVVDHRPEPCARGMGCEDCDLWDEE